MFVNKFLPNTNIIWSENITEYEYIQITNYYFSSGVLYKILISHNCSYVLLNALDSKVLLTDN